MKLSKRSSQPLAGPLEALVLVALLVPVVVLAGQNAQAVSSSPKRPATAMASVVRGDGPLEGESRRRLLQSSSSCR